MTHKEIIEFMKAFDDSKKGEKNIFVNFGKKIIWKKYFLFSEKNSKKVLTEEQNCDILLQKKKQNVSVLTVPQSEYGSIFRLSGLCAFSLNLYWVRRK